MTSGVPSLKELAAQVVIENNDIDQLQPVLPPEMIDYLKTISGEIPLDLASQFFDKYNELFQAFRALGGQEADNDTTDQFLAEYQESLHLHDSAAEALTAALSVAVNVTDQAWREYLVSLLTDVQENVKTLGERTDGMIEHLTWLRALPQ
jgi:hypothetical protein